MADSKTWRVLEGLKSSLTTRLAASVPCSNVPPTAIVYGPVVSQLQKELPVVVIAIGESPQSQLGAARHAAELQVFLHCITERTAAQGTLQFLVNFMADVRAAVVADEELSSLTDAGGKLLHGKIAVLRESFNPDLSDYFQKATGTVELRVPIWWDHTNP